jgi:hypothetical protein
MWKNEMWAAHDDGHESKIRPLLVQRLVGCLNSKLRKGFRQDLLKDALLEQMHDDAAARVVIASP